MKLEIVTGGEATEVVLDPGALTLGGGDKDGLQIAGLPEAALELRWDGQRLMVRGQDVFTVDDVLSPPGISRLVVPGERIDVGEGVSLRLLAERIPETVETAAVLKELLGGTGEPEEANCAHLTCLTGLDVGRKFPIHGDRIDLGRGEEVDIRVRDRAVSRRHARIRRTADGYLIEDLRTPNGMFVNGRPVKRPALLADGAIVEVGQSLLRFRAGMNPPPPPPAEPQPAPAPPPGRRDEGAPGSGQPPPPAPRGRRRSWELAWMAVGVVLALVGVLVSFSLLGGG